MIQSAEEFVKLRDDDDPRATYDKARPTVWKSVIDRYPAYKRWILQNKNVPVTVLRMLARDSDPEVRFWVAQKRKCPAEILEILARDTDMSVRERIAWNVKTPVEVLEILRDDPCEGVSEVAAQRLEKRT